MYDRQEMMETASTVPGAETESLPRLAAMPKVGRVLTTGERHEEHPPRKYPTTP